MPDLEPILQSWKFLAAGLLITLELSALTIALGLTVGLVVGILRTYGWRWLAAVLSIYVDTARSIPQLVILVWTYFAFPVVSGHSLSPMQAATLALGLHLGAYVSEVIRAGLTSIRPGQMRAGLTLGMTRLQTIRSIILPQATIRMMPPLGSLMVIAVKDTSIAAVIAVPELMRQSQIVSQWTFRPLEIYTGAMIVYFLVCYPLARGVDRLYQRLAPRGAS